MALRTKTIEYAFPTVTSTLAAATRRDLSAITLYIPETSSRTFRSVIVEVTARNDVTTAASMTSWLIGIKLGSASFSDVTTTVTLTATGDFDSTVFTRDVTSYFTSNFGSGSSQTCQVGVQYGGQITANHTAKVIITYEYDDSSATTRAKTVRIPLESNTSSLTNSLASIGSDQIPDLDAFLPEASKTYRSIWLECWFNDGGNATTDFSLGIALTGGTTLGEQTVYRCEQGLNSAVFGKAVLDLTSALTTSDTANVQARSNNLTSCFSLLAMVLHVTYEYDHSSSTTIINSLVLPFADETGWPGSTTSADVSRFDRTVWIEEPSTITLVQSGALCLMNGTGTCTLNVKVGAQSAFRAYTMTAGSVQSGPYAFTHRIDSGSAVSEFGTLARGRNVITFDRYITSTSVGGSNFSSFLYLNYTSGKHADGDGVHNHTTCWSICDQQNLMSQQRNISAPNTLFTIPESSYHTTGLIFEMLGMQIGTAGSGSVLQTEYGSGEGPEAGWCDLVVAFYRSDSELGAFWTAGAACEQFQRFPGDPDTDRMALETTRQYRMCTTGSCSLGVRAWLSYHAITFAVSGTVSGSSGGTVDIALHRTATGEKIGSTSRSGNGSYSITWYDDTEDVYTVARESSTLLGRSDDGTAA